MLHGGEGQGVEDDGHATATGSSMAGVRSRARFVQLTARRGRHLIQRLLRLVLVGTGFGPLQLVQGTAAVTQLCSRARLHAIVMPSYAFAYA